MSAVAVTAAAQPQQQQPSAPLSPAQSPQPAPTPGSPGAAQQESSVGPVRRKTSRRANTAERRATHNAVERQRRETLNSRFLDLAQLLPNLASVRRPSKSAIVNSSIVLIHAQRRARAIAGRELRNLKAETDAYKRELDEWRARAGLPRSEEVPRSADFNALMVLEEAEEMGEDERRAYEARNGDGPDDDDDEPLDPAAAAAFHQAHVHVHAQAQAAQMPQHAHAMHVPMHQPQRMAIHTAFDAHAPLYDAPLSAISMHSAPADTVYGAHGGYAPMFTPPGSSHGVAPQPAQQQTFLAQQQQQRYGPPAHQLFPHALSGASDDDAASVGSVHSHPSEHGGSPPRAPMSAFDLVPPQLATGMAPREMVGAAFGWPVQFKPVPVAVGGGNFMGGVMM